MTSGDFSLNFLKTYLADIREHRSLLNLKISFLFPCTHFQGSEMDANGHDIIKEEMFFIPINMYLQYI